MKASDHASKVLRCWGHRQKNGRWYGVCIDLNLAVEAYSRQELEKKLEEVIQSYVEAVCDTDDKQSIPRLLNRRAPLSDWVTYYLISAAFLINNLKEYFIFQPQLPKPCADYC